MNGGEGGVEETIEGGACKRKKSGTDPVRRTQKEPKVVEDSNLKAKRKPIKTKRTTDGDAVS